MKNQPHSRRWALALGAALAVAMMAAPQAQAATVIGQLGILDVSGNNPATGQPWQVGDTYHLLFVTTDTTNATSTNIADYNAFVQGQANAAGMGTDVWGTGTINWFALGSTSSVNAIDNAVITGPVINVFNNGTVGTDEADFWNFRWPDGNPMSDLNGTNWNVWTGTERFGSAGNPLGSGSVRRYWTGWTAWGNPGGASATESSTGLRQMVAISQQLTVLPEPSTGLLVALGGLLALLRRRR